MQRLTKIHLITLLSVIGIGILVIYGFKDINNSETKVTVDPEGRLQYKWYAPRLPEKIDFAGEPVPLDRWEVRERLDRDILSNYYMHGGLLYILKLSHRYFPEIEQRLKLNGVPDDFKYLCVAESSLQHLTSSAGAKSFWQFLSATATQYGLEVNDEVDERYHIIKATDAACKYLKAAKAKFGTWTAAAASYNCGMGGYNSASNFQGSSNYYDLHLPEETNRYIFRIIGLKYLISNAKSFGYILDEKDIYKPLKTRRVEVNSSIPNLADFAQQQGSSYKLLKQANPWLRDKKLTVKGGKTYYIDIPLAKQS